MPSFQPPRMDYRSLNDAIYCARQPAGKFVCQEPSNNQPAEEEGHLLTPAQTLTPQLVQFQAMTCPKQIVRYEIEAPVYYNS